MMFKKVISTLLFIAAAISVYAQDPSGASSGYEPSIGPNLTINIKYGRVFCNGTTVEYQGGSVQLTNNATNYIVVDTTSSCGVAVKTTPFTSTDIPIATAVTNNNVLVGFKDVRPKFWTTGSSGGGSGSGNVNGSGTSTAGHFATINNGSATAIVDGGYGPSSFDTAGAASAAQTAAIAASQPKITVNGMVKCNGSGTCSAGVPGTDFAAANASTSVNGQSCALGGSCSISAPPNGTASGDLSGSFPSPTVSGIKGSILPTLTAGYLHWNGSAWALDTPTQTPFTAAGDLSGSTSSQTVVGIQGQPLPPLSAGYPHWNGSAWVFDSPSGSFTAGGDLSGTSSSQTVNGIKGSAVPTLAAGYLHWNGSAWVFDTPAGGSFTAGGDLTGSSTSQTVSGIEGKPLPALASGYPHYNGTTWVFDTPSIPLSFIRDELAVNDAVHVNDCTVTAASTTITCNNYDFPSTFTGKTIAIAFAGTVGTHSIGNTLVSSIVSLSNCNAASPSMCKTVVINDAPSLSITGPTTYSCNATLGSFTLSGCTGGTLSAGDIGKGENGSISIAGIGPNVGYGTTSIEPLTIYIDGIPSSSSITMNKMSLQTASAVSVTIPGAAIVAGTNNYTALQNGVNASCSSGRPLAIDPGRYLVYGNGSAVSLCNGVSVYGFGQHNVSVFYPTDSVGHFFMVNSPSGSTLYQNETFHDFEIDNSAYKLNSYVVSAGKLSLNQAFNVQAYNLYIHDTPATSLAVDASYPAWIYNNDLRRCGSEYVLLAASGGGSACIGNGNTPTSTNPSQNQTQFIAFNHITDPGNIGIFNESESTNVSMGWLALGNMCSWAQTGFRQCYGDHGNFNSVWQANTSYYAITGISAEQGLASTWPSDIVITGNNCFGCNKMINVNIKGGSAHVTNNFGDAQSFNMGAGGYTGNFMTITCQSGGTCGPITIANNTLQNYMSAGIEFVSGTFSDVIVHDNRCIGGGFYTASPCVYQAAGTIAKFDLAHTFIDGTHINYGFKQDSGATITEFDDSGTNNFIAATVAPYIISGTVTTHYVDGNPIVSLKAQTATIAYTSLITPKVTSSYELVVSVSCTAASASSTIVPSVQYYDASNTLITLTGSTADCTTLGTGSNSSISQTIWVNGATSLKYQALVSGTPTYDFSVKTKWITNQ